MTLTHDPMTLIYEHDLAILKMHLHTKHELSGSRLSKVREYTQADRQTDIRTDATDNNSTPHSLVQKARNVHHQQL